MPTSSHQRFKKPIIASLPADVDPPRGSAHSDVKWLHCVQAYPCELKQLHLSAIRRRGLAGFSDHTGHPIAGALAVYAGAHIVEAHVKLARTSESNYDAGEFAHHVDWPQPAQFSTYVQEIREAERTMGDGDTVERPEMAQYRVTACR